MTKSELKNIIKGLIIESINESKSKNFVSSKKTKKLKEQDEMEPVHPQASAEPDAGEVEGPEVPVTAEENEHAELLAQIDGIIGSLNSLKANLLGHAEGEEVEQSSDVQESSDELDPHIRAKIRSDKKERDPDDYELLDGDDDDNDYLGSARRLGYVADDDDDDQGEGSEVDGRKNPLPRTTPSGLDVSRGISTGSGKPFPSYGKKK